MYFLADQGNPTITAESEWGSKIFQANLDIITTLGKTSGQSTSQENTMAQEQRSSEEKVCFPCHPEEPGTDAEC